MMKRSSFITIMIITLTVAVAGLLVVGCTAGGAAPEPTAAVGGEPELDGSEWVLSAIGGEAPLAGTRITLQFDGATAGGNAGCNSYGVEVQGIDEGRFEAGEASRTAQACVEPAGVMAQEDAYLQALVDSSAYRLEGDRLTLVDEAGAALLVFRRKEESAADPAALVGSSWRLTAYNGEPPQVRRPISLVLGESRFWGQSECRSYVGGYQATEDDIVFPSVSMLGEPCADEQLFLPESGDYQLEEGRLIVTGERGDTFAYEAGAADELVGAAWRLLAFIGPGETPAAVQEPLVDTSLTASFKSDGTVGGSSGCNDYGAVYEVAERTLQIRDAVSTEQFCEQPEGLMAQERQFAAWLAEVRQFQVGGGLLWLAVGDDRALLFERAP